MNRFNIIKEYFNLSRSEKLGLWFLLLVLFLAIVASIISLRSNGVFRKSDFSEFEKQIDTWENSLKGNDFKHREIFNDLDDPSYSTTKSKLNPFKFNPNNLEKKDWKKLGLSDKQIKSILNYRQKGGVFRTKSDLSKMYSISKEEYEVLEPYIDLPDKETKTEFQTKKEKTENLRVELNSADTSALKKIKGIGSVFSRRIISFRSTLKGFSNVAQLKEVKGFDSAKYSEVAPFVFVNPYLVQKMNINTISFEELKKHPYFGYNIALSLINYRKQHGQYQSLDDIKKSALITDELFEKISPYLTI